MHGKNVMSAQMMDVSTLGVGTVIRLERDAWSMVEALRQATNEYPPTPVPPDLLASRKTPLPPPHNSPCP